ncbi:aminopeptidase N [Pelistega sp. MC2]|uniref:aminopeptidase N n=1 Tax=Pelistega sp. MC2 TaxID=1720297 RepID=UPI0008DB1EE7|nr:aminopeptidase N [Pelistega sp. MC2]
MSTLSKTIYRKDYKPFPFTIHQVNLHFYLEEQQTKVTNTLIVEAKETKQPLCLNGEDIELVSIHIDDQPHTDYEYKDNLLFINTPLTKFKLTIVSICNPSANSTLMGLYVSGKSFFTQCEAEGFRRITFFPDRPDVMSEYFVTLNADKTRFPMLLSNGNLLEQKDLENNRHEAKWHDPFKKPCYLFALVAGDFDVREKTSTTRSGREVLLQVYSDKGSGEQTLWALDSLERAMFWDEKRFGLELDLNRFMIVVVRDFNMGAMENKGLNIFNASYVLADPETATDTNYTGIEAVVGHEYFHNWTGNRVTCRDWFQLSLKEGLTVFRDQEFTADMMARNLPEQAALSARAVKRIDDVTRLRTAQFPEDAGPMAHPIRPDSYQEIGNFYTSTVYEKGAEIIRMQHTLLGEQGFRTGMDEYFRRHDGQAVTCDDFVNAMESIYTKQYPQKDFAVFRHWYSQAGTPRVKVEIIYDEVKQTCAVTLTQSCEKVGVEKLHPELEKKPFFIPFHIGMIDAEGNSIALDVSSLENVTTTINDGVILELKEPSQTWIFQRISRRPFLSLLRDFSAPVYVDYDYSIEELAILCAHDKNPFARWEAAQELSSREILRLCQVFEHDEPASLNPIILDVWKHNLTDRSLDSGYRAWLLTLPAEKILFEKLSPITPLSLYQAREFVRQTLGSAHEKLWLETYQQNHHQGEYSPDPISAGQRSLKNLALAYLISSQSKQGIKLALQQYQSAQNMTDRMGALSPLLNYAPREISQPLSQDFNQRFQDNPLVMDKWFTLEALAAKDLQQINGLMQTPLFTLRNPNRARALLFQFCINNTLVFHAKDGSAYQFWADKVCELDRLNPEVAARFARIMDNWQRYASPNKEFMQKALQTVAQYPKLSKNTTEIVSKALNI